MLNNTLTLLTVSREDFKNEYVASNDFGRIVYTSDGKIIKSVEVRDASAEEIFSFDFNPCYYCFNAEWLWKEIKNLKNNNAQREYYLTDLVNRAANGYKISSIRIHPSEAIGVNTKEQLDLAEKLI